MGVFVKINKITMLSALVLTNSIAHADFVGLHLIEQAIDGDGTVEGTTTWRLFAEFDNANDQLHSVGGSPTLPGAIYRSTSFYQNPFGGYSANHINAGFWTCPTFPSSCYDSWITIGAIDSAGNQMTSVGLETDAFESGDSFIINNGSWSVSQDDWNAFGVELEGLNNFHVLVGQFTIYGYGAESKPWGQLNLSGVVNDGTVWVTNGATFGDEINMCPDTNGDGLVNISDLLSIIDAWGQTNSPADVSGDGVVDVMDLLIVVGNWGAC